MSYDEFSHLMSPVVIDFEVHDPNDVFMKDVVSFDPDDYQACEYVILGCPQDQGVARNCGRPGAARAPGEIRKFFYKLKPPANAITGRILDLGDVLVHGELEDIHSRLETVVSALIRDGKTVVVLGGGNDISFPDALALGKAYPDFTAINLDAHLDMRLSERVHSGTGYRNLIESGALKPENFHEVGTQVWANSPKYLKMAEEMGVNIHTLRQVQSTGIIPFFTRLLDKVKKPVFVGLDMDSVRTSDAPGVSAPSSVGFSAMDVLVIANLIWGQDTRIFEITEVNPAFDQDGRTCRLAATAVHVFLFGM